MSGKDSKDRVFSRALSDVKAFEFNETVANVFHDMISRSVPGYALLLHMIGLYADIFIQPGSRVSIWDVRSERRPWLSQIGLATSIVKSSPLIILQR
jgi:hypothetical protein